VDAREDPRIANLGDRLIEAAEASCVTPGRPSDVTVKLVSSPKTDARALPAALLVPEWADGYSWK
jgi:hypothetical protein